MSTSIVRKQSRLYIAFALFVTSILAAFAISIAANRSESYWIITRPLPAGVQISSGDITKGSALIAFPHTYLLADSNPLGAITTRNISRGEILTSTALTKDPQFLDTEEVSISVRSSDIPGNTDVGDLVTLYQVQDSRDASEIVLPRRILVGAFISAINRKGSNFGSEVSITLAISQGETPKLLSATSNGRIVIVAAHGG